MAEDRTLVFIGAFDRDQINSGNKDFFWKMARVRNAVRQALDPLGTHAKWLVSSIFVSGDVDDQRTYGFLVRHMNGGSPTGPEWLFLFHQRISSSLPDYWNQYVGNYSNPTIEPYFVKANLQWSGQYFTDLSYFSCHWSMNGGLDPTGVNGDRYDIGWDSFANAEYDDTVIFSVDSCPFAPADKVLIEKEPGGVFTANDNAVFQGYDSDLDLVSVTWLGAAEDNFLRGGIIKDQATGLNTMTMDSLVGNIGQYGPIYYHKDFQYNVTKGGSNIFSNLPGFMPTAGQTPRGFVHAYAAEDEPSYYWFMFDWNKPFCSVFASEYLRNHAPLHCFMGNLITPYDPAGIEAATLIFNFGSSAASAGSYSYYLGSYYDSHLGGGSRGDFTLLTHNNFGYYNSPRRVDRKYPWDIARVYDANEMKGYLNTDLFRNMGRYNEEYLMPYEGPDGPFLKRGNNIVVPWVTGEPLVPPVPWGQNNNTDAGEILDVLDI